MTKSVEYQARYVARQLTEQPDVFRARAREASTKWRKANPEKVRAHGMVANAVKKGHLVRPDRCESCHKACKPQGAHTNYDEPLNVRWLCQPCHKDFDATGALRARIRELEEEVQYLEAECRGLRHVVFQLRRDLHER